MMPYAIFHVTYKVYCHFVVVVVVVVVVGGGGGGGGGGCIL